MTEYRFLVLEHRSRSTAAWWRRSSAPSGVWLGITLTRKKPEVIVKEVPVPVLAAGPFVCDEARVRELGITPRELEILGLIAEG